MTLAGEDELLGNRIQGCLPGNLLESRQPDAFVADPPQGPGQPAGMVLPLGITRHLCANHAGRIIIAGSAPDSADPMRIEAFDLEGAGTGAIMGAGAVNNIERHGHEDPELMSSATAMPRAVAVKTYLPRLA
jgi:hypothetical protein